MGTRAVMWGGPWMHVVPSRLLRAVETIKYNLTIMMELSSTAALRTDKMMLVVSMPSMSCSLGITFPINTMDTGPRAVANMPDLIWQLADPFLQLSDPRGAN